MFFLPRLIIRTFNVNLYGKPLFVSLRCRRNLRLRRRLLFVSMASINRFYCYHMELIESVPHSDKPWDVLQKAPL